jgi:hypothetical protein
VRTCPLVRLPRITLPVSEHALCSSGRTADRARFIRSAALVITVAFANGEFFYCSGSISLFIMSDLRPTMIGVNSTFIVLSLTAIGCRMGKKVALLRSFGWHDGECLQVFYTPIEIRLKKE